MGKPYLTRWSGHIHSAMAPTTNLELPGPFIQTKLITLKSVEDRQAFAKMTKILQINEARLLF